MVTLNRAIAAAMVHGPARRTRAARRARRRALAGHYRLDAVRAHLLEMAGDTDAAIADYRAAAARTTSIPEQHYLTTQAARLRQEPRNRPACGPPDAATRRPRPRAPPFRVVVAGPGWVARPR